MSKTLSSKVERCPTCGKIKSKEKPCKVCTGVVDMKEVYQNSKLIEKAEAVSYEDKESCVYDYYVVFLTLVDNHIQFSGETFKSTESKMSLSLLKDLDSKIKSNTGLDNVCILNIMRLEH